MIVQLLIFQGVAIFLARGGCRLQEVCETVPSEMVDPFVTEFEITAQCSRPDASMWYIRRYENGIDSLDGLGAPLTLNDSFRQIGNQLDIQNVNGFAEGAYHCGVDIDNLQPASLCLFVRGQPFFTSCPGEFGKCPSVVNIMESENISLDTRIDFTDGGFCNFIKIIRFLLVFKDGEEVYRCSNLTTFENQLCEDNDMFRVELQQSCTPPDTALCKYDMKLVFLDFDESDEGVYEVEVVSEDDQIGRRFLTRQFNITGSVSTTDPTTRPPTTPPGGGLTDEATIIVIVVVIMAGVLIFVIILIIIICVFCAKRRGQGDNNDQVDGAVDRTALTSASVTRFLQELSLDTIIDIGVFLGLREARLKTITAEHLLDEMVDSWLRGEDHVTEDSGTPSWERLCEALNANNCHKQVCEILAMLNDWRQIQRQRGP